MAKRSRVKRSSRIGGFLKGLFAGLALAVLAVAALVFLAPDRGGRLEGERLTDLGPLPAIEGREIGQTLAPVRAPEDEEVAIVPDGGSGVTIRPVELPELSGGPAIAADPATAEPEREAVVEEVETPAAEQDGNTPATDGSDIGSASAPTEDTQPAGEGDSESPDDGATGESLADEDDGSSLPPPLEDTRPITLSGPALSVNAATYEAAADAPLVGVIIGNVGSGDVTPDVLFALPVPATVGIVPGEEGDEALAAAARARNWEVVAELPIIEADGVEQPGALTPEMDAEEVAARIEALMGRLAQAVAALDDGEVRLGDDPAVYGALVGTLEQYGFAYVGGGGADGPAGAAAEAEGLPYARATRSVGQDASAEEVYAALDEAMAEAETTGAALVVLPSTRAAVQALARWNAEKGAGRLAPLSAVIRKQTGG